MLSGEPVTKLSMAITRNPSAIRRSLKWDPRNPAPPVTRATFLEETDSNIRFQKFFRSFQLRPVSVCGIRGSPAPLGDFVARLFTSLLRRTLKFDRSNESRIPVTTRLGLRPSYRVILKAQISNRI